MRKTYPYTMTFDQLPDTLPVLPLASAVLLPRQQLALHLFEPRYLSMFDDCLKGDRHIGIVRPRHVGSEADAGPLCRVGCAGRIAGFQETGTEQLRVQLTGICRFEIFAELQDSDAYRRVRAGWEAFRTDLETSPDPPVGLEQLEDALRHYFEARNLDADWGVLRQLSPAGLIDFLATNLPLDAEEKQAFVEAPSVVERAQRLQWALEVAAYDARRENVVRH